MRTNGVKVLDPGFQTRQCEWLLLSVRQCPDAASEQRIIMSYFRAPQSPTGALRAFVRPVQIRRSRHRVLFCQELGIEP
jgi:hypothetical protein